MSKQITAYFRPQADLGHSCIDIDGGYHFDVTSQIQEMGLEAALALDENHEERDDLWRESVEGQNDPHHGPFEVDLDYTAIRGFFKAQLAQLETEFEAAGGRGVYLAERIDELRRHLD